MYKLYYHTIISTQFDPREHRKNNFNLKYKYESRRRLTNINPAFVQCLVFVGYNLIGAKH